MITTGSGIFICFRHRSQFARRLLSDSDLRISISGPGRMTIVGISSIHWQNFESKLNCRSIRLSLFAAFIFIIMPWTSSLILDPGGLVLESLAMYGYLEKDQTKPTSENLMAPSSSREKTLSTTEPECSDPTLLTDSEVETMLQEFLEDEDWAEREYRKNPIV